MIDWEEGEDIHQCPIWLRYVDFGHWGLILTAILPRYVFNA